MKDLKNQLNKIFLPEGDKLKIDNEQASAKIMDAELDILECDFNNDGCVVINTDGYTYVTLTLENLEKLKKLIYEADRYYASL